MRRSRALLVRRPLCPQAGARGDHWRCAVVDGVDDLARIDPLEVNRRDAEVRMSKLSLDDRQRNSFVRHLDRVRVPELVRREPPTRPARAASRRSSPRAAVADEPRPRVGPARMQNNGPIGRLTRCSVQRATYPQPQSSIPTILRLPPLPARTSTALGYSPDSVSASASLILKPARQRIAISPRILSA
jgi:hypothetical protein